MDKLIAWRGSKTKQETLALFQSHIIADTLRPGSYGREEGGKHIACTIGCLTGSNDHKLYETLYGIPVGLAYIHEAIFEDISDIDLKASQQWSYNFLKDIPEDANLGCIQSQLTLWLINNPDYGLMHHGMDNVNFTFLLSESSKLHSKIVSGDQVSPEQWLDIRKRTWNINEVIPSDRSAIEALRLAADDRLIDRTGMLIYQIANHLAQTNVINWPDYSLTVASKLLELLATAPISNIAT